MANTLLTIDMVTREALRVAHEQCQFIGTVDRQYDSSFANTGAKIGSALRVRRPNQYTRTQGSRVMDVQEQSEIATSITVATPGVAPPADASASQLTSASTGRGMPVLREAEVSTWMPATSASMRFSSKLSFWLIVCIAGVPK